ncbi:MAG: hypothetical protein HOH43_07530, partial [Candidatus Latescibacteria bacterium]|nr:hypothetical protein [Candidatus Latescibacterota bacterium]
SKVLFDHDGPFGNAIRFNQGYIYGAVEREDFDETLLDIRGRRPFTMIAWAKFVDRRHLVAGIWDEGGWDKYDGRRQVALFAGLFGQKGAIAHITSTGSACYPQSTINGSQYARCRAIDGQPFENGEWVALAMTFDPERGEVGAYLNGTMTPLFLNDPVAQNVFQHRNRQAVNPYRFTLPIFSPRAFVLKFNGYNLEKSGISEHRLSIDLDKRRISYEQDKPSDVDTETFRVFFDILRTGASILPKPVKIDSDHDRTAIIPTDSDVRLNDEILTSLEIRRGRKWEQVGAAVRRKIRVGAPFTFGRALGLGAEKINEGSHLFLDGVAVFNRVMKQEELKTLSFTRNNDE